LQWFYQIQMKLEHFLVADKKIMQQDTPFLLILGFVYYFQIVLLNKVIDYQKNYVANNFGLGYPGHVKEQKIKLEKTNASKK
jgi:hypothetical protein